MKSIDKLSYTQRSRLLHQLFPDDIFHLLQFLNDTCRVNNLPVSSFLADRGYSQIAFGNGLVAIYQRVWLDVLKLEKSSRVFSKTLFSDDIKDITIDLVIRFVISSRCRNRKFGRAVELLLLPDDVLCN